MQENCAKKLDRVNKVNKVRFVTILPVVYISLYSFASRIRSDTVELIVRKFYLLLWWSFCI